LRSAALLALVRPRPRGAPARRSSILAELREGYGEVRSRPWVWVTIAVFAFHLVVGFAPYVVLGPSVAEARYGDPALWGWIAASVGLGTAGGALIALRWRPRLPLVTGVLAAVPFGLVLLAYALGAPLVLVVPCAILAGVGLALFSVWWETALAQRIPPGALSRVAAYDWMGSYALLPLGMVLIGVLADQLGATAVMGVAGSLAAVLVLLALVPRETRSLTQLAEAPATALHSGLTPGTSGDLIP
jgi:hypothetical protein